MNLTKLFESQKILRDRINYQGEDRFEKLVLALLVELGECANEWRGFKFWSKNQEPRTRLFEEEFISEIGRFGIDVNQSNPLLEEYVDGLHFVLELGIELNSQEEEIRLDGEFECKTEKDVLTQFEMVFSYAHGVRWGGGDTEYFYINLVKWYLGLGEMLGFTPEQIESGYYAKNKINHQRQETGY